MFKCKTTIILVFLLVNNSFGQQNYNYQSPLDIPLVLAANFGELRPHHFHMGLDFKTNSKEGYAIRSIQKGYVSRVCVSRSGYGKVVYIDHENGQTSVYAHCSAFKGQIDSLVKRIQEREQNAEVDVYLKKGELNINRGQIIALSGNTGGSSGPHLHFELRNTATEEGLNPLLYGFNIADHKAPEMKGIKVVAVDSNGFVLAGKSLILAVKKSSEGQYIATGPLIIPANFCSKGGGIGFAFEVIDRFDDAPNSCGLYASELAVNGKIIFKTKIDKIPFEESRYINCHMDHTEFIKGKDYHRSFKSIENPLNLYADENQGIIRVKPGDAVKIGFTAWDVKKNKSILNFDVQVEKGTIAASTDFSPSDYFLPSEAIDVNNGKVFFHAEPHTIYEPLKKQYSLQPPYSLGDNRIPIQKEVQIQIPIAGPKQYLEIYDEKGRATFTSVDYINGSMIARPKNLGLYTLKTDSIPPTIKPLDLQSNRMKWFVKDDQTDLLDYDLFIDGNWVLLEYEKKGNYVFYDRNKNLKGEHTFKLILIDRCGNKQEWLSKIVM
jgi:hypothetical protein